MNRFPDPEDQEEMPDAEHILEEGLEETRAGNATSGIGLITDSMILDTSSADNLRVRLIAAKAAEECDVAAAAKHYEVAEDIALRVFKALSKESHPDTKRIESAKKLISFAQQKKNEMVSLIRPQPRA